LAAIITLRLKFALLIQCVEAVADGASLDVSIDEAVHISCSEFDVHGSVHRNIKLIEKTNKMQPRSRIYYSNVS
jgi:hypothetical protein